ncbi:hypothetical protein P7F88_16590 [Vibrio hannami]|uniref:hypothetical protein n=1 Tax=Vibrio hannami TaxID=2717094 RepID=UPI00240FB12C|nr:hypothetical protein [Vibrio hannami]MDG3087591.1 hypothetical protein [Vibrio hannami]
MSAEKSSYMGQSGVWLKNADSRLFVQEFGGMTPEFSAKASFGGESHWVNTHWNPHFRTPFSGLLNSDSEEEGQYWGIELMRQAAGCFPCGPTFGPGNEELLPHGDLASGFWSLDYLDSDHNLVQWSLDGSYESLRYKKWDMLSQSGSAHIMILEAENTQSHPVDINLAWHTTLGAPFLERGCQIVTNCNQFITPPLGTEFDDTCSIEPGSEFCSLEQAPGRNGEVQDRSTMPGYNGHSEFITGVSNEYDYLWSACVNPHLNLAYLTLIPLDALPKQANAGFMNYWMHSGGRNFAPWADYQGGVDRNYALGMETSIGASCLGLDHSRKNRTLMGKPSVIELQPGQKVMFPCINSLFEIQIIDSANEYTEQQIRQEVKQQIHQLDLEFKAFLDATNLS